MEKGDDTIWYFTSCADLNVQIKVLGEISARFFVEMLNAEQASSWLIEKEGGRNEIVSHNSYFHKLRPSSFSPSESDIRVVTDNRRAGEKRKYTRVSANLNVKILKGKEVFDTKSIDISVGGIFLQSPIPESFLFHICVCHFTDPADSLTFSLEARIIKASADRCRLIFDGVPFKVRQSFETWITQYGKRHLWRPT